MKEVKGDRLQMSGESSADERRIACGRSADDPPLICRPNFSWTEINSFGLHFICS
jgi:hypothetical protein